MTLTHPTHPTLASLLEAVRLNPDEDTTRLALADWLDEGAVHELAK